MRPGTRAKLVFTDETRTKVITGIFVREDSSTVTLRSDETNLEVMVGKNALVSLKELPD